jgi:hypothetical protein
MVDLQLARLERQLEKRFRYLGTVYTWRSFMESGTPYAKRVFHIKYAARKVNGCYAELKQPRIDYCLCVGDNRIIDCPKLIYDWAVLPVVDRTTD